MRQAILCCVVLLLSVVVSGCGRAIGAVAQPEEIHAMSLTDLRDVSDLQARFNQDAGKPRLLLLVSPT
jgi:hypothetical protein